jgi:hypothetical protein
VKPHNVLAMLAFGSFCLTAYFSFLATIDAIFAAFVLLFFAAIAIALGKKVSSRTVALTNAQIAKLYPPYLTHLYLYSIFGQLTVALICLSMVAFFISRSRRELESSESGRFAFRRFFILFLFLAIITGLLTFSSIEQYGFPLVSLRTLVFWAFIAMCLAVELSIFSLASKWLVSILPKLLWFFSLWTRLWSYVQMERYQPFELGPKLDIHSDTNRRFWYRFIECLLFSFPFLVIVTALPPSSLRVLLEDLIPTIGRSMLIVGVYLALMYGLFVLEIVGVTWKGSRVSVKRLNGVSGPSIVISFLIAMRTWVSVNVTYALFVIWLYVATFVLLSIVLVTFEPMILNRFWSSADVIARRSRGKFVVDKMRSH